MASNYSNYFFSMKTELFAYDEYVYGRNYATGSSVFTGSSDSWNPVFTGSIAAAGLNTVFDNYIFSPRSFGNFRDTLYCPPQKYVYTINPPGDSPPISTTLASSSYSLSINQDLHSRISLRYVDGVINEPTAYDYTVL